MHMLKPTVAVWAVAAFASAVLVASGASAQQLYKWTDEHGNVYYSDIPPEYSNRHRRVEADQRAQDEIARHDRMLLETYSSVREIEDLRDRRLGLIESQIKLTEADLSNLRKRLVDLKPEASDMAQTAASIAQHEQNLARIRAMHRALKKSFDDDIARFIDIKGV
jgi:hypothetical protein